MNNLGPPMNEKKASDEILLKLTRMCEAAEKKGFSADRIRDEILSSHIGHIIDENNGSDDIYDQTSQAIFEKQEPQKIFKEIIEPLLLGIMHPKNEVKQQEIVQLQVEERKEQAEPDMIKIEIVTQIQSIYEAAEKYKSDFSKIFKNCFKHFQKSLKDNLVEPTFFRRADNQYFLLFEVIKATQLKSGGSGDLNILPDDFEYQLLPSSVQIKVYCKNSEQFFHDNATFDVKLIQIEPVEQAFKNYDPHDIENRRALRRFEDFLRYFINKEISYPFIDKDELSQAVKEVQKKFYGIEGFLKLFNEQLLSFTSYVESVNYPKGIVLYGPPGTGKSAITKELCNVLGLLFATQPMAAGDLKKGIVGDSEKTVNAIANRARIVPWQMCLVFIDEIDSLAPDRNASSSNNSNEDLIGVLLSTLDGAKTAKNMKIIATTNLLNKIDAAFLRRMEIQLFLGNPSKSSRIEWIPAKGKYFEKKPNGKRITKFLTDPSPSFQELRDTLVMTTINFSADAYRKVLERFYSAVIGSQEELDIEMYKELMTKNLRYISEEMKIFMGGKIVCEIIQSAQKLKQHQEQKQYETFRNIAKGEIEDQSQLPTRIILIDLKTEATKEKIQIEMENINFQNMKEEEQVLQTTLSSIIESSAKTSMEDQIRQLFQIFQTLPGLRFKDEKLLFANECLVIIENCCNIQDALLEGNQPITICRQQWNDEAQKIALNINKSVDGVEWFLICCLYDLIKERFQVKKSLLTLSLFYDCSHYNDNWAAIALEFAIEYDSDIVILIDQDFFKQKKAYDDTTAAAVINETVTEAKKYNKAVIIFDLDSIAGIKKDYTSLREDLQVSNILAIEGGENAAQFSYHFARPLCFESTLNFLKNASKIGPLWFIAVSDHNKVIVDFKQYMKWSETESERIYQEEEIKKDQKMRCKRCLEIFTPRENENEAKCRKHRKQEFTYEVPGKDVELKDIDEVSKMINSKAKECLPTYFKYICCGGNLQSKGEIPCKHVEGEIYDPDSEQDDADIINNVPKRREIMLSEL